MGPVFRGHSCYPCLTLSVNLSSSLGCSTVCKSSLCTIPCPPHVHHYNINVLFPVEAPWYVFFSFCQSHSLLSLLNSAGMSGLILQPTPPSFQDLKALTQLLQTSPWCNVSWITESRKILSAVYQVKPAPLSLAANSSWTRASRILCFS